MVNIYPLTDSLNFLTLNLTLTFPKIIVRFRLPNSISLILLKDQPTKRSLINKIKCLNLLLNQIEKFQNQK